MMNDNKEFNEMVNRLFKADGFNNKYDGLLHAVVGLASEVDELREAIINGDRENLVEELGDFNFYYRAAIAQIELIGEYDTSSLKEADDCVISTVGVPVLPGAEYIASLCCITFDIVKRGWVYGKTIDYENLLAALVGIISIINRIADDFEIANEEILAANMHKLENVDTGRYKEGEYTDRAAVDRRDKA